MSYCGFPAIGGHDQSRSSTEMKTMKERERGREEIEVYQPEPQDMYEDDKNERGSHNDNLRKRNASRNNNGT